MIRSAVLLVLGSLFIGGCATEPSEPISFPRWQQSLERYVWQQGDGDPTVLRELSWDDAHPGFAILGEAVPERSTDVFGLLLEHRHIDGKPYFIFLVATVHDRDLEDLQPVALNVGSGRFHWFVGAANPGALAAYRKWILSSEAAPDDEDKAIHFPAPTDSFQVLVRREQIEIVHDQTGSTWKIDLQHESAPSATQPAG